MKVSDFNMKTVERWTDTVREAQDVNRDNLDETTESYLVFMMMRFDHLLRDGRWLREAAVRLASPDQAGYSGTQMRDVGDYCLLICSFVPVREHVQVSKAHDYVQLGRGAYWQLATSNTGSVRKLFTGLCDNFCQHVRLLQTVQENEGLGRLSPLESHAWWQKTGMPCTPPAEW